MKPLALVILSEPEAHSGQLRLQKFVISIPAVRGIPEINCLRVRILERNEKPASRVFIVFTVGFIHIQKRNMMKDMNFFHFKHRVM
jgi:hypothetical protein